MSTEETKVTTNEVKEEIGGNQTPTNGSTQPSGSNEGDKLADGSGSKESGTDNKSKEINEEILEFLKKQSDTIEKQSKIIEQLTKANEEIHKKVSQVESRVDKNAPTVIGSYNFDAEMKSLNDSDLQAYETKAKETLDFISTQFNIN